jgi:hypothetical protein
MRLGESYNFSNIVVAASPETPVAAVQIPQLLGASSDKAEVVVTSPTGVSEQNVRGSLSLLTPYIVGFIIGLILFVSGFVFGGNFFSRLKFFRSENLS